MSHRGAITESSSTAVQERHLAGSKRHGHDIIVTHFESGQRFDTDEEALAAGVKLARHQIDIGCEPKTPIVEDVTASAHATGRQ